MLSQASAPLDPLWRAPALVTALICGEAVAILLTLASSEPNGRWVLFGLWSLVTQWIVIGTLAGLFAVRRQLARASSARLAAWVLVVIACVSVLVGAACWTFLSVTDSTGVVLDRTSLVSRLAGIGLTMGAVGAVVFLNYARARRFALEVKQAELDLLQARIRPHFLFNTLNTATALVHTRPDQAERVLLDLADLFRASLGKASLVRLDEELELTRRYLDIEKLRFGRRLVVDWNVPDKLPVIAVPPLSIQPLVENAVRHGIEPSVDGGVVSVNFTADATHALIEIVNQVSRNAATSPATAGHGVGLRASIARIEDATSGQGSVRGAIEGGHYVVRVRLPIDVPIR